MTPNEYQEAVARSAPSVEQNLKISQRMAQTPRLLHAILGIHSEGGEFADNLKKHLIYGQLLDYHNVVEECGDKLWYISLALTAVGITLEECMMENIEKLKLRYPEKFTEQAAKERADKQ